MIIPNGRIISFKSTDESWYTSEYNNDGKLIKHEASDGYKFTCDNDGNWVSHKYIDGELVNYISNIDISL